MKQIEIFGIFAALATLAPCMAHSAAMCAVSAGLSGLRSHGNNLFTASNMDDYGWGRAWSYLYSKHLIEGIGMCSESKTDISKQKEGVHCWCKTTKPILGSWVYVYSDTSYFNCSALCASDCGRCIHYGKFEKCERLNLLPEL
ncbi:MAG: hypothetical protein LBB08_01685 [Rickettsiales bacterium]|jgi:hypothetical protein|nr:hypothetical protein [Rickettsiales bacterium]